MTNWMWTCKLSWRIVFKIRGSSGRGGTHRDPCNHGKVLENWKRIKNHFTKLRMWNSICRPWPWNRTDQGPTNEAHVPWETNPSQLAFGFYRFQKLNRTDIYVFLNWDVPVPVFKNCCRWLVTKLFSIGKILLERRTMASWSDSRCTLIILPKAFGQKNVQFVKNKHARHFMRSKQWRYWTQSLLTLWLFIPHCHCWFTSPDE